VETLTAQIPGLAYVPAYLEPEAQLSLFATVDSQPWLSDLRRRVQHYGYRYDYTRKQLDPSLYLGPLPAWAAGLAQRLHQDAFIAAVPDQLIVNEYLAGQGIASHVDCVPCFGDTVLSLSLGGPCVMDLTHVRERAAVSVLLEPGSLLVLRGAARYAWKHGIAARKTDTYGGRSFPRRRRVSLTFRTVLLHSSDSIVPAHKEASGPVG
jgi:alkylated DNA repair dioxygenase AlkB